MSKFGKRLIIHNLLFTLHKSSFGSLSSIMRVEKRSLAILTAVLAISIINVAVPSAHAYTYNWYKSTRHYNYHSNSFPYRYVFYTAPYYYYVQDNYSNLASQVQSLQTQLQTSQSDRSQAMAQAQQLTAQIESMRNEISNIRTQMDNSRVQYASQMSDLRNTNQALQANLDAIRTQNIIMLVLVVVLGACIVGLLITRKR